MKRINFALALAFTCFFWGGSARADLLIDFTGATNPLTNVNNYSPGTSSLTQQGQIGGDPNLLVEVASDLAMFAQGATTLDPSAGAGTALFNATLTMTFPELIGIRDFSQNLDFNATAGSNGLDDLLVTVDYLDPLGVAAQTSGSLNYTTGSGRFDVWGTMGEIITAITLSNLNGSAVIASKQIRINPDTTVDAVPEPSSMLLLGTFGIGVAVHRYGRRRRTRV